MRDGALDALHCGHVVVVDADGAVLAAAGDADTEIYPRSALKPFQAAATLAALSTVPASDETAITAASHTGSALHQAAVRRVLDHAGAGPGALRCPRALPTDPAALRQRPEPARLAHNCSGKHAGFLRATGALGAPPRTYLDIDAPIQVAVREWIAVSCGSAPVGPGTDGCGAPAWRVPMVALARGYARLARAAAGGTRGAADALGEVARAMRAHPLLVGGEGTIDSVLMAGDRRVLAKRGAEATLGVALLTTPGPLGVAIRISDGGVRALGPVAGAVLGRLGVAVPEPLAHPVVLGGGVPHGNARPTAGLRAALGGLAA